MTGAVRELRTVVFLGSARDVTPPWGGDARLCDRVAAWVTRTLRARRAQHGDAVVTHSVQVLDPLEVFSRSSGALAESGAELRTPHFFLASAPPAMDALRDTIRQADCYVIVTPEYNHSIPPALTSLMGHFGGSNYAYKPAAAVTYSVGPWGGQRCAMALRPFLAELGCLSVSKLTAIPTVTEILDKDGNPVDPKHRMLGQLPKMLDQLEWLTLAVTNQRNVCPPP